MHYLRLEEAATQNQWNPELMWPMKGRKHAYLNGNYKLFKGLTCFLDQLLDAKINIQELKMFDIG